MEPGKPGELIVQGDIVSRGYYNNPVATKESFRNGWFYTGDIAVERGGKFYIVDRKKVGPPPSLDVRDSHTMFRKYSNIKGSK